MRACVWTEEMYDELKKYLAQKMSSEAISKLMKVGRIAVESKIHEKGWKVWRGKGKSGRWITHNKIIVGIVKNSFSRRIVVVVDYGRQPPRHSIGEGPCGLRGILRESELQYSATYPCRW